MNKDQSASEKDIKQNQIAEEKKNRKKFIIICILLILLVIPLILFALYYASDSVLTLLFDWDSSKNDKDKAK